MTGDGYEPALLPVLYEDLGLQLLFDKTTHVVSIASVVEESPASRLDFREGDTINFVNDEDPSREALDRILRSPGRQVTFEIYRSSKKAKKKTHSVVLRFPSPEEAPPPGSGIVSVSDLPTSSTSAHFIVRGIRIKFDSSLALVEEAFPFKGLLAGDEVRSINGQRPTASLLREISTNPLALHEMELSRPSAPFPVKVEFDQQKRYAHADFIGLVLEERFDDPPLVCTLMDSFSSSLIKVGHVITAIADIPFKPPLSRWLSDAQSRARENYVWVDYVDEKQKKDRALVAKSNDVRPAAPATQGVASTTSGRPHEPTATELARTRRTFKSIGLELEIDGKGVVIVAAKLPNCSSAEIEVGDVINRLCGQNLLNSPFSKWGPVVDVAPSRSSINASLFRRSSKQNYEVQLLTSAADPVSTGDEMPWLGLSLETKKEGLVITKITPGGPAYSTGRLAVNDVIKRVNDVTLLKLPSSEWTNVLKSLSPGDDVLLFIGQGRWEVPVTVRVGTKPQAEIISLGRLGISLRFESGRFFFKEFSRQSKTAKLRDGDALVDVNGITTSEWTPSRLGDEVGRAKQGATFTLCFQSVHELQTLKLQVAGEPESAGILGKFSNAVKGAKDFLFGSEKEPSPHVAEFQIQLALCDADVCASIERMVTFFSNYDSAQKKSTFVADVAAFCRLTSSARLSDAPATHLFVLLKFLS